MEEIALLIPRKNSIHVKDITGVERTIRAKIEKIDFVNHKAFVKIEK